MLLYKFINLLYPSKCPFCKSLKNIDDLTCPKCVDELSVLGIDKAIHNNYRCISAYPYIEKYKNIVLELKYGNNKRIGYDIGGIIALALEKYNLNDYDYVTEVPLSKRSLRNRGYNQSKFISLGIEKYTKIKHIEALAKVKNALNQHTLTLKQRKDNVKDVYECVNPNVKGKRIILVDDVCTTGYTLSACADALKEIGASEVLCCSFVKAGLLLDDFYIIDNKISEIVK